MKYKLFPKRRFQHLLSAPLIYFQFFPVLVLDVSIEIYHRFCFPLYGLKYVKRSKYVKIDRHKLKYLNPVEKAHCMYCGYVNGFLAYAVAIAGETEKYWCGIMHEKKRGFKKPKHHKDFLAYNDEEAYQNIQNSQ